MKNIILTILKKIANYISKKYLKLMKVKENNVKKTKLYGINEELKSLKKEIIEIFINSAVDNTFETQTTKSVILNIINVEKNANWTM